MTIMNKDKWIRFTCSQDCHLRSDGKIYCNLDYNDSSDEFRIDFLDKSSVHGTRVMNEPEYLFFNDEAFELRIQDILTDCIPSQYLDPNNKDKTGFAINEDLHLWQLISAFELEGIEFVEALNIPEDEEEIFLARHRINKELYIELVFKVYVD